MLKEDRPRVLYVALLAAVMALASIVAANSAQAQIMPVVYGSGVPVLPDSAKTPGEIASTDQAEVCGKVNGKTYEKRNRGWLTEARKDAITRAYGQVPRRDGDNELDHRVPAALGGKSSALNVWWQPGRDHGTVWDYHVKDLLDSRIWREVCVRHTMTLAEGQAIFMEPDWRRPFCRIIGGPPCPP